MPTYIKRTVQEYVEFYKCLSNPHNFEFSCPFCWNFYKTKCGCISHMKKCCSDQGMEYDNSLECEDGVTIYDYHQQHAMRARTIKGYITNNELASLSDLPSSEIIEKIKQRLLENGFNSEEFYLHTTSFHIYKFFFIATDEDKSEFRERFVERLSKNFLR